MRILLANFSRLAHDSGGLAKVNCLFANEMVKRGHEVSIVYTDPHEGEFFFPLDKKVKCYNLQHIYGTHYKIPWWMVAKREILRPFSKVLSRTVNDDFMEKYLLDNARRSLEEIAPDVIITFQPLSSLIYLTDLKTKVPVISMSHGDPADYFETYPRRQVPAVGAGAAAQVLMPSFAKVLRDAFPELIVRVIGNVVPQYEEHADLAREKNIYKIIFIGRLVKNHKRPHLLLKAFASLAKDFPNWQVELWGGDSRKSYTLELKKIIKTEGLEDRVFLKGTTNDVASVLREGDLFVFPSAYEGFGLTPAEAMSMGLPTIGYKSCVAVNELIEDGKTGFLVDDGIEPLAQAMRRLMEDKELRIKMGAEATRSMQKYAAENIWAAWDELIADVTEGKEQNL